MAAPRRNLAALVEPGSAGIVLAAVGLVLLLAGLLALFTDRAAGPTTAALVIGALLAGGGTWTALERRPAAALQGSVWQAIEHETKAQAALAAHDVPEAVRPLLADLAHGNAAQRYVELSRHLRRGLQHDPSGGRRSTADVIAGAVTQLAGAAVDDAHRAVRSIADGPAEPEPGTAAVDVRDGLALDETAVLTPPRSPSP